MGNSPKVILLLGEEPSTDLLAEELTLDGYRVRHAHSLQRLPRPSEQHEADLIILTASTQQVSLLRELRALRTGDLGPEIDPGMRVLWVTATGELAEVLRAFDAGADDVIRSPFHYAELLARVRALMRRAILNSPATIRFGALQIDTDAHTATFASTPLRLRRLEYALLVHLARNPARVYTKRELLRDLWGYQADGCTRTVDTHACRLRAALAAAGAPGWLTAVRGVGYRLAPHGHGELRLLAARRSA